MPISIGDLDELLGYDPATHSVAGIPSMKSAQPAASNSQPPVASIPSARAPMAAPDIAGPSIPSSLPGGSIPSLAPPTKQQASAAGKNEFKEGLPTVTAAPLTPEYFQQERAVSDYKDAHPWGSDVSAHPGTWGKIGHIAAEIGNDLGDIVAPKTMANIPGTKLNEQEKRAGEMTGFNQATEDEEKQAAAKKAEADIPLEQAQAEHQQAAADALNNPAAKPETDQGVAALAKLGLKRDNSGNVVPMEESELTPELRQARDLQSASQDLKKAQTALANSKNDPQSAAYKLEQAKVDEARERTVQAAQALGLHQNELTNKIQEQNLVKPSGQTTSRGDAAGAALELLPNLEAEIRANAKTMGPLWGRIAKGEINIGDVDPQTQKLYSAMQSFYSMQPAIHGFRNANFVKDFDSFVGSLQTNPDAVIAGLEGLKPTLEAVEKSGRTFKPRIVQGGGDGTTTPPSGGKTYHYDANGNRTD